MCIANQSFAVHLLLRTCGRPPRACTQGEESKGEGKGRDTWASDGARCSQGCTCLKPRYVPCPPHCGAGTGSCAESAVAARKNDGGKALHVLCSSAPLRSVCVCGEGGRAEGVGGRGLHCMTVRQDRQERSTHNRMAGSGHSLTPVVQAK